MLWKTEISEILNNQELYYETNHELVILSISSDPNVFVCDDVIQQSNIQDKLSCKQTSHLRPVHMKHSNFFQTALEWLTSSSIIYK